MERESAVTSGFAPYGARRFCLLAGTTCPLHLPMPSHHRENEKVPPTESSLALEEPLMTCLEPVSVHALRQASKAGVRTYLESEYVRSTCQANRTAGLLAWPGPIVFLACCGPLNSFPSFHACSCSIINPSPVELAT